MSNNHKSPPPKLDRNDINQDKLPSHQQQPSDESALDMMKGLHEHETHEEDANNE